MPGGDIPGWPDHAPPPPVEVQCKSQQRAESQPLLSFKSGTHTTLVNVQLACPPPADASGKDHHPMLALFIRSSPCDDPVGAARKCHCTRGHSGVVPGASFPRSSPRHFWVTERRLLIVFLPPFGVLSELRGEMHTYIALDVNWF